MLDSLSTRLLKKTGTRVRDEAGLSATEDWKEGFMPKVRVNHIDMYYEVHGQGEPLLLIMGLGANTTDWEMQIPAFSREYKVVAFDNRGSGRTDMPPEPYTMELFADDTASLLKALGIRSAHVYGMSMGGMIAQELALRHPQRVRTLILGAASCGGPNSVMAPTDTLLTWANLVNLSPEEAAEGELSFLYSAEFISPKKKELVEESLRYFHLRPPPDVLQRQFMAIPRFDTYDRLPQIRAPTLVLTGTADAIVPAENSRILAERIPGAQLVQFEGAGHGFLVEAAEEANAAVLDFLRRHRQGPAK